MTQKTKGAGGFRDMASTCLLGYLLILAPIMLFAGGEKLQGLERMAAQADIVFKGRVMSTIGLTNKTFPICFEPHATKLKIISVLKGTLGKDSITFIHNTEGPHGWGGGTPPPHYLLKPGRSYLIFAEKTDQPNVFRQLSGMPGREDEGAILAADDRPLTNVTIFEAHWLELSRLLTSNVPDDALHAIIKLNFMSKRCGYNSSHTDDFSRENVLDVKRPVMTNADEKVAVEAINCFQIGGGLIEHTLDYISGTGIIGAGMHAKTDSNCVSQLRPYSDLLISVASGASTVPRRVAAVAALSGIGSSSVSNALPRWLSDSSEDMRVEAVRLLLDFPGQFAEETLNKLASDKSASVRSVVADIIGTGQFVRDLPVLEKLFSDPIGLTALVPPLKMDQLQAGERWNNTGDVHTSAGMALIQFKTGQVEKILRKNLSDAGFHVSFIAKLAEDDAKPWLDQLQQILEVRFKHVQDAIRDEPLDYKRSRVDDELLTGAYGKCWEAIRHYLMTIPAKDFSSDEMNRYMDLLEKMIQKDGSWRNEPAALYELYRSKGLAERTKKIRVRYEKSQGWRFDQFDRQHAELDVEAQ